MEYCLFVLGLTRASIQINEIAPHFFVYYSFLVGARGISYRMSRVINPEKIIGDYLQQQLIKPLEQEGRKPTAEEIHNSILTAAATLLINLDEIGEFCFETAQKVEGSNIKVISTVALDMDEIFKMEHPDLNYQELLIDKQEQLLKNAKELGIPTNQLL